MNQTPLPAQGPVDVLVGRLRAHAEAHEYIANADEEQRQWMHDLYDAADALERDEARVIAYRLTAELDKCAAALPGAYYMDQPDGGDVSVSEQLKRMAKDAERYRMLRRKFAIISDGEGHAEFCAINLPRPTYIAPSSAIELDTALDRERLGLDGSCAANPAIHGGEG